MRKNGVTLIELLVVIGIFLIMISILAPFTRMAKIRANRIACANNLRRISLGLHSYAAEHDDAFPPDLKSLYPNYVELEKTFDCPTSKARGTSTNPDYGYVTGLTEASSLKEVIAQDLEGNHKKAGKNILRVNGSVEWIR